MPVHRGYEIEYDNDKWWAIKLNGKRINVQSNEEQAYSYIDAQKRKQKEHSNAPKSPTS